MRPHQRFCKKSFFSTVMGTSSNNIESSSYYYLLSFRQYICAQQQPTAHATALTVTAYELVLWYLRCMNRSFVPTLSRIKLAVLPCLVLPILRIPDEGSHVIVNEPTDNIVPF
jgi:hypothetical protein